ncbi:MAG: hypothetical protein HC803_04835 [Saprospiraceae bacterium]|nr:hypothetical protein [Saprospiraceae bacterium]
MPKQQAITISLKGSIHTGIRGYNKIIGIYHEAKVYKNTEISLDFSGMTWIDANLCSLLNAIEYRLKAENNIDFVTDFDYLYNNNFDVLFRNGFLKDPDFDGHDYRGSTVQLTEFGRSDKSRFLRYINNDLMFHERMPRLDDDLFDKIIEDLIEVYCNYEYHAKTAAPFFICGQYYPTHKVFKVSMVDVGVGFLDAIQNVTQGRISTHAAAIKWAVQGNSTKEKNIPGGLGLQGILDFCYKTGGKLEIVSGDAYWKSGNKIGISEVKTIKKRLQVQLLIYFSIVSNYKLISNIALKSVY